MKNFLTLSIFSLMVMGTLCGCSKDEVDSNGNLIIDPIEKTIVFQANGEPMFRNFKGFADAQHEASYASVLFGNGWKHLSTHEVLADGTIDAKNYWEGMDGGGPYHWYFDSEQLFTQYFFADAIPASAFSQEKVAVDLPSGRVSTEKSTLLMQMGSLFQANDGWHLITLEPGGIRHGIQIYHIVEYRTMTAQELQDYQTKYTYDWNNRSI